ncbi:zinc finger protein Xfin-like isoform X2 [Atheta coriaria]|uniref:zinc finger protein Xfin-like isoform X2 n=1 Tax=Dalotia coriaria TaxID=877792 RepID=UPI0031F44BDD
MEQSMEYVNFRTCCRLCLDEKCQMANIFSAKNRPAHITEKILSVVGIKVTLQDKVTTNICDRCFLCVKNYDNFKKLCLNNQIQLAKHLSVFEAELLNESIQIKEEPASDDEVVYVPSQIGSETPDQPQDDELPPILSPNLPTAEMLRNLEVEPAELIQTIEVITEESPPSDTPEVSVPVSEKPPDDTFRVPEAPTTPKKTINDSREQIDFAATLQLAKKMDYVNLEPFTKTEIQYSKRMKLIYTQLSEYICACHNKVQPSRKALLGHLKKYEGVYLPPYSCQNCCTTFTRSGFSRHRISSSCKCDDFEYMHDVSNCIERGINKHRNYQAFKCKICHCTARLFDSYAQHVEEHLSQSLSMQCICEKQFTNSTAFKQHLLSSCVMKPSCDMCDLMFDTLEEFKQHCTSTHDDEEGEEFMVDDSFQIKELPFVALYACVECNLKCKQELFLVRHLQTEHGYDLDAAKRVGVDCYIGPQNGDAASPLNNNETDGPPALVYESEDIIPEENQAKVIETTEPTAYKQINSQFECQVCFKSFSNAGNFRRHLKQAHQLNKKQRMSTFNCGNCEGTFSTMEMLQNHLMNNHIHACKECGRKCASVEELDKHRASHLKISLTRDPNTLNYRRSSGRADDDDLDTMPVLSSIDEEDIKALNSQCKLCKRLFATARGLGVHMRRTHKDAVVHNNDLTSFPRFCKRTGCHVSLKSMPDWSLHMQMHAESDGVNAQASSDSTSPAHTDDTDYSTCNKCFKVFANRGNLKQHMRTHGVGSSPPKFKRYFCSICKYVSKSNQEWIKHRQSHLVKSTAIQCKFCKVGFASEEDLNIHMRDEHAVQCTTAKVKEPDVPQICEICNKKLPSKESLRGHIGWHKRTGTFRLKNDTVGTTGASNPFEPQVTIKETPATLNINKEKLFKDKTYICITCGKLFPSTTALQSHQTSVHGKLRCPTCWKFFERADELNEHMRLAHVKVESSTGKRPALEPPVVTQPKKKFKKGYEYCKICGAEFGGEEELRDHTRDAHPGVPFIPKGCCVCPICDDEFRNMAALSSHVRMHQRRGDTMPSGGKKSTGGNKTSPVVISKSPATKLFCGVCKKSYEDRSDLRRHILDEHPF